MDYSNSVEVTVMSSRGVEIVEILFGTLNLRIVEFGGRHKNLA